MHMDILNKTFRKSFDKNKAFKKSFGKNGKTFGKNSKKGQLQIQETILAVFIFIVLIMFGLIFFYKVQSASIKEDFNKFQRERLEMDFITLGDLPELSCSKAGIKESCIDSAKLIVFSELASKGEQKQYYFERFGYKNITIYQVYPKRSSNNICSSGTLANCGIWEVYVKKPAKGKSKDVYTTLVSLYFSEKDDYGMGLMVVEAYES